MEPGKALLSYLLADAEFGLALLSIGAARLEMTLRLAAANFVVFHGVTAAFEVIYMASVGVSGVLVANMLVRVAAGRDSVHAQPIRLRVIEVA